MRKEQKIELGKFTIDRYDHYYDTVNNKCSLFIALNTFLLGGICAGYITLYDELLASPWLYMFAALHLLFCLISILCTLMAMMPFTRDNYADDNSVSLLFFGGVSRHTHNYFHQKFSRIDEEVVLTDISRQIHCLAKGLTKKFRRLKTATCFLFIQFLLLLPFLFFIIKNYKK